MARFDHWINANAALSFGSLNDAVPLFDDSSMGALAPSSLGNAPMPTSYQQGDLNALFNTTPASVTNGFPQSFWPTGPPFAQNSGPTTSMMMPTPMPMDAQAGFDHSGSNAAFGVPQTGENSDEYWNALIDGESSWTESTLR